MFGRAFEKCPLSSLVLRKIFHISTCCQAEPSVKSFGLLNSLRLNFYNDELLRRSTTSEQFDVGPGSHLIIKNRWVTCSRFICKANVPSLETSTTVGQYFIGKLTLLLWHKFSRRLPLCLDLLSSNVSKGIVFSFEIKFAF